MATAAFKLDGLDGLLMTLSQLGSQMRRNVTSKALTAAGRVIRDEMRAAAPVRHEKYWPKRARVRRRGTLRRSIRIQRDINFSAGRVAVKVGVPKGYNTGIAAMTEKGTIPRYTGTAKGKGLVDLKTKEPKKRAFRGSVRGTRWMTKAIDRSAPEVRRVLIASLENGIRKAILSSRSRRRG